MEFKAWLEGKFIEWRGDRISGASVSEFSRDLGVSQQQMSDWMIGRSKPGTRTIPKLAARYPDVYQALGLDSHPANSPNLNDLPEEIKFSLQDALKETTMRLRDSDTNPNTPEGEQIVISAFEKHGFTYEKPKRRKPAPGDLSRPL